MRAYTIVVQPATGEGGHIATVPDLPGWAASGRTVEECVEHARAVIGLSVAGLERPPRPLERRDGAAEVAEEEAIDALRRAMAALRTVESHLEEEITRLPGGDAGDPLRRAHGAVLRARTQLVAECHAVAPSPV